MKVWQIEDRVTGKRYTGSVIVIVDQLRSECRTHYKNLDAYMQGIVETVRNQHSLILSYAGNDQLKRCTSFLETSIDTGFFRTISVKA